jgi:hypothetical protein
MVEVFKTDVRKKTQSKMLLNVLGDAYPSFRINFDLSDCDKVLRIEGGHIDPSGIILLVKQHGFTCEVLD